MTGTGERTRERPTGNGGDLISPVGFRRTVGFMVERKAPIDAPKKRLFCELWQEGEAYEKTGFPRLLILSFSFLRRSSAIPE
ncbi:hypothetical protein EB105725_03_00810 [Shimwellia blattae DSM 4481 = NBRC 105725]|nr:hypothetical protein EB105725_03_00810 [Shimwellia blattae DSM 4481 = NBRC 105725]